MFDEDALSMVASEAEPLAVKGGWGRFDAARYL